MAAGVGQVSSDAGLDQTGSEDEQRLSGQRDI